MGITLNDIAAQRAMLARGEEKRKADWKQAERERLRDTFAAAALTGLLSHQKCHYADDIDEPARDAYAYADAMLRERNGAPFGCGTVPDPDSRVWETPCTPQPHATPSQGSTPREGTFSGGDRRSNHE